MANIILRGSHSLKILNIVLVVIRVMDDFEVMVGFISQPIQIHLPFT